MIRNAQRLAALEAAYEREAFADLDLGEALDRFCALWRQARAVGAELGADWREDVEPDIEVARAVNGLPPRG